jgi:alanine-synthesizing transaminase
LLNQIDGISCVKPKAAFYCFPKVDIKRFGISSDEKFVLDLLRAEKILLVHGTGFNWSEPDHFRVVYLPRVGELQDALARMNQFMLTYKQ